MSKRLTLQELREANPKMARLVDAANRKDAAPQNAPTSKRGSEVDASDSYPAVAAPSLIVRRFEQQLSAHGFPAPEREYFAIPGRDFRWDYAWPQLRVLVEIQGAQHRIKKMFKADIEKRALAMLAGWRCLELDRHSISTERSVEWLSALLLLKGESK
jgi:hypothetical protein